MKSTIAVGVALIVAATAAASANGPPGGLSNRGRALWNFEALLHDTFGNRMVCTENGVNFVAGDCSPLATWSPYLYVFSRARHSAFHLTRHRPSGPLGNYPVPIMIRGRFVACGPRERTWLIRYSDATSFTLDCVAPLP